MISPATPRILALCSASVMLALQSPAQESSSPDTLALKALNRSFHLLPVELSIDLTHGSLMDSVPNIKGLAAGYAHIVLGRYQSSDSVKFSLTFRRDSAGGQFGGYVSRRARIETIEVTFQSNIADKAKVILPQFREAMSPLGEPQLCTRDTVLNNAAQAIVMRLNALWRRDDATVLLEMTMNVMEPLARYRTYAPRFYVGYIVRRSSDDLLNAKLPTRHDSPCFFTDEELREHATPLDSATYESWRVRLKKSSP